MDYPSLNKDNVQTYYPLGGRTLFMMILKKSPLFFAMLIAFVLGMLYLPSVSVQYADLAQNISLVGLGLLIIVTILVFFSGWLQYFRYGIIISEKNLIIKKGFIATEEIGIPFRRIRDLKIKRSLVDQIFGVSDIVVILSDFEEQGGTASEESIVYLPSLEKTVAVQVQQSILKKSQVEQIDVLSGHENMLDKV